MASMRIRLLFFAVYRDLAGASEMELDVPRGSPASLVVQRLRALNDGLAALPARPVVAVNREYAALSTELHDGDELALLPPVAGG